MTIWSTVSIKFLTKSLPKTTDINLAEREIEIGRYKGTENSQILSNNYISFQYINKLVSTPPPQWYFYPVDGIFYFWLGEGAGVHELT